MVGNGRAQILAWGLGLAGAGACIGAAAVVLALGVVPSLLVAYLGAVAFALLGALVAAREPRNSIGWIMCVVAPTLCLAHLPAGYGYLAEVVHHGEWPLGGVGVWLSAWGYVPALGLLIPLVSVRFPDGIVPPRWRFVDWLAAAGTILFGLAIALQPWNVFIGFIAITGDEVNKLGHLQNGQGFLPIVQGTGLMLIVAGYVAAAASLIVRFRGARGDAILQLRWFAYAGALVAIAFVYAAVSWNFFGLPLYLALTPFEFAVVGLPIAIGVAILRYRLYDIDLIINRTLVYGTLTAILGAVYAAVVTLLNRLFISVSGQRSDAAYVVTAFVVVIASSPIKDWLQRQVDRRFPHRSPSAVLDEFRGNIEAVVSVIDSHRVARRFLDEAVDAFDARSAALYLDGDKPIHSHGELDGDVAFEVVLRHEGRTLGRLVMGSRRGDAGYTQADRAALQRSADAVGEALVIAVRLGEGRLKSPTAAVRSTTRNGG